MSSIRSDGCDLYYEEAGQGIPILLIHPAGATAATWGSVPEELARIERVITYDRRGYARSGGEAARSMSTHTADAAAIPEYLRAPPAVVVGTSAGAAIAVDLVVRRPDLVQAVIAHEFPMAVYSSASYRFAGRGACQNRITRSPRPIWRRRRGIVALRLHLP
jgi:pimeloyl-ACP methyl ester carboxylesterase